MDGDTHKRRRSRAQGGGDYSYWIYKPRNAEDGRQLPEARGDEEGFLSQSLQREHAPADTFISDYENKFLLISVIQFIILCLGSRRKVIHMFMEGLTSFPIFLKLIYKSNTTAIKIPACFKKEILKPIWKHKRSKIATISLERIKKIEGLTLPDFKTYFETTVNQTMWLLHKSRCRASELNREFRNRLTGVINQYSTKVPK